MSGIALCSVASQELTQVVMDGKWKLPGLTAPDCALAGLIFLSEDTGWTANHCF